MKNILFVLLISCFCLSIISCASKSKNADRGVAFYREVYGEWGWHEDGDQEKDGKYEGEIRKGEPHGQGTYIKYSGTKSKVLLLSFMIPEMGTSIIFALVIWEMLHHGEPKILYAKYVGKWNRGRKHGDGTYFFSNGDKYVGEWRRGEKHGDGIYFFSDGDKYEGEWRNGKKHGQGTYTFSDGDKFIGEWKEGKAHGKGAYTYPDGDKFVGEWMEGKKHRQGKLILSD